MPPTGWLDVGDRVASIIGAVAGVASLAVAVARRSRAGASAGRPAGRAWRALAIALAAVAVAAGALRLSGVPLPVNAWLVSLAALVGGVAAGAVHVVLQRRRPMVSDPALRTLLTEQWEHAGRHRYQFFDGHAPALPHIYVEQYGDEAGGRAVLTVEQMLRRSENVLVVAGPGMGKSMMVAHIVWRQCRWWLDARRGQRDTAPFGAVVPVVVAASRLVERGLYETLAEVHRTRPDRFDAPPVPGARWLVLVDGIDEVLSAHERARVLEHLATWLGRADRTAPRFAITTRALSFGELADVRAHSVGEYRLRRFDARDLRTFASRWFTHRAGGDAAATVELFLHRIDAAGLGSVVEIPLLATITALLFDGDRDRPLPTSRAGLYASFVRHLLYGRREMTAQRQRVRRELARYGPAGAELGDWLDDNLEAMLEAIADEALSAPGPPLPERVRAWTAAHAPAAGLRRTPGWAAHIDALLASTGLLDGERDFTHRSLAEYLAAGPRGRRFDEPAWFAEVRSPDTRGAALFVLARSAQPADPLAETLLAGLDDDVVTAGHILADGIEVSPPLRRRVVAALERLLVTQGAAAAPALRLLAELAGDPAVAAALAAIAAGDAYPPWVRVLTADALDRRDPAGAGHLERLARDASLDAAARQWALHQSTAPPGATAIDDGPPAGNALAAHAYREALLRGRGDARFRLQGALLLADRGDPVGAAMLRELLTEPALGFDLRLAAARTLLRIGGDLRGLALDPARTAALRGPAAVALAEDDDFAALDELLAAGELHAHDPAVATVLRRRRAVPVLWNVPARNRVFAGRDDELARIDDLLSAGTAPVLLHGVGGIGKTQIAIEYAYRCSERYDIVWWVSAEQSSTIRAALTELGTHLGAGDGGAGLAATVDALRTGPRRRWLLIFDNVVEPAVLEPFLSLPGHILVTSRLTDWADLTAGSVEVPAFARTMSVAFLTARMPHVAAGEAEQIAELLGDLPLAVEQAAAWMLTTSMPAQEYVRLLRGESAVLLDSVSPDSRERSLDATVRLAFDQLSRDPARLLRLCAFFGPDPIPVELLRHGPLRDELRLRRALRDIGRVALARVDATLDTVQVHRLVQILVRGMSPPQEQEELRRMVQEMLVAASPDGDYDRADLAARRAAIAPHVIPAGLVDGATEGARRVVVDQVRHLVATGDRTGARTLASRAADVWTEALGPDHPDVALLAAAQG